jgi:histidyl-tRNA synthetase
MYDRLPDDEEKFQQLVATVLRVFGRAGYRPISVPVLEPAELFMLKSGEEIVSRLYSFNFRNQHLCLRPEITASVIRAYIEHLADRPGPTRLSYFGPVFRYEPLEVTKYREFSQIGVELIGAYGPGADAEVIQLALDALEALGISIGKLVVGHVGIASAYLKELPLEERLRTMLLWHIDQLKVEGKEAVLDRISTLAGLRPESSAGWAAHAEQEQDIRRLLTWLIDELDIDLTGSNRSPDDIVARLVGRLTRPAQRPVVEEALDFLEELTSVAGPPEKAVPAVRDLLQAAGVDSEPADQLEQVLNLLEFPKDAQVWVDFAMSRGLHYYTGLVFELFASGVPGGIRVGGGGRYDGLVGILGGDPTTPACGFALHAHRLLEQLGPWASASRERRRLAVVPEDATAVPAALKLARSARRKLDEVEVLMAHRWGDAGLEAAFHEGYDAALLVQTSADGHASLVLCQRGGSSQPVRDLDDLVARWIGIAT